MDERILAFVIAHPERGSVSGKKLWKEAAKLFPGKTWQSLKQRYKKFIATSSTTNKSSKAARGKRECGAAAGEKRNMNKRRKKLSNATRIHTTTYC